jgi:hypothetical protein
MTKDNRSNEEKIARMDELTRPIDQQLMMCDDFHDQLMIASYMLVAADRIFRQHIGESGAEDMFKTYYEDNFK